MPRVVFDPSVYFTLLKSDIKSHPQRVPAMTFECHLPYLQLGFICALQLWWKSLNLCQKISNCNFFRLFSPNLCTISDLRNDHRGMTASNRADMLKYVAQVWEQQMEFMNAQQSNRSNRSNSHWNWCHPIWFFLLNFFEYCYSLDKNQCFPSPWLNLCKKHVLTQCFAFDGPFDSTKACPTIHNFRDSTIN